MSNRKLLTTLLFLPGSVMALSGCEAIQHCPYGESLVRLSYSDDWVCMATRYQNGGGSSSGSSGSKSPSPSPSQTPAPAAAPTSGSTASPVTPDPPACGGVDAQSDSIRVVDKSDPPPALSAAPPNVADGTYQLVQASFFGGDQGTTPVRTLKATVTVRGAAVALGVKDTTFAAQPTESLTFLVGSDSITKTCESTKGAVSAWFFPFAVGAAGDARLAYDGATGILRLIVKRNEGTAELVFAK